MKTGLFLAAAGLCLAAVPALAGDPSPAQLEPLPAVAAPVPQVDWSGFWLGASLGRGDASVDSLPYGSQTGEHHFDADGSGLGLHLGYNLVLGDRFVLGAELSHHSGEMTGTGRSAPNAPVATHRIEEMTTLRLRAGVQVGRALPYVAFGAARADATRHSAFGDQTAENAHRGTVLAAGVEWAMTDHLSLRAEYQHFDLGEEIYDFSSGHDPKVELTGDMVQIGVNFRF